jgi:hypothetical protein
VGNDRLSWYWHSKGIGGHGILDYLMKVENMGFREAVDTVAPLCFMDHPPPMPASATPAAEQHKTLVLPEKAGLTLRLFDYLCIRRGIDSDIVHRLIQEGKLYEDKRGNVVFVGHDEHGRPKFASLRGTYGDCRFRMDCAGSDKRYGFNTAACGASARLYVFESPIDLMSHASLAILEMGDRSAWEYDCRLSLAGTSDTALPFFLNEQTSVKELFFCLDNDPAGQDAAASMAREYGGRGYKTAINVPQGKDYNEDLMRLREERTVANERKNHKNAECR